MLTTAQRFVALFLLAIGSAALAEPAAPDLSTPKKTLISIYELIASGQVSEFPSVFVEPRTDEERTLLECGMSDDYYIPVLANALKLKFPDAKDAANLGERIHQMQKQIEQKWEEQLAGETATVNRPGAPDAAAIHLQKVGKDWKLTLQPGPVLRKVNGPQIELAKAQKAAYLETAQEVAAGKYATAKQAMEACDKRRRDAFEKYQATQKPAAPR